MSEFADPGRQLRVAYAFGGATVALRRTVPLLPDEGVLFHGVMRLRGHGLVPRPAVLRVTPPRLVVLAHFAFRRDQLWELPRTAIRGVAMARGVLQITWTDESAGQQIMQLSRWTGRAPLDRPLTDAGEVAERLTRWLSAPNGGAGLPPAGHQRR